MIASVSAAALVLKTVAVHPGVGLSELSRLTGLQKSRTFRILETLVSEGFVDQTDDKSFYLGIQSMIIGQSARRTNGLLRKAERLIDEIALEFDENIQLRVRDRNQNVQIFSRKSQQRLRVESSAGNVRPLGKGASGRLLLAFSSTVEREALATEGIELSSQDLAKIRSEGFAHSNGELTKGIEAVAVPILDGQGNSQVCLSASAPSVRMSFRYKDALVSRLKEVCQQLSVKPSGIEEVML
ncbi:IclR family transcriptional regulator [Corynebacterium flavescens]|uniref:IclR family transcriptional regulator n=1 Tax=Corynebacterium flavescens TaxID=28028 RepID=UPI003FD3DA49